MTDKDAALLARSAAVLRAEGKADEADQLDAAVDRLRHVERVQRLTTPGADLTGVRAGTFRVRDTDEHPVPKPPPLRDDRPSA